MLKRVVIWISLIVILVIGVYAWDKALRCKKNGYMRDDATKIALKKLEVDFKNLSFSLKKEEFDSIDNSWIFTYYAGNCVVDVIVDRCGLTDIGGLTEGCITFQKTYKE